MITTTDKAEIEALFQKLSSAHADHDADAIVEAYAPDAAIFDLAPPLARRGLNRDTVAAWLGGWDGPIEIDAREVSLTVGDNLAFVSELSRIRGRQGGENQDLWYRTTRCLQKIRGRWQIIFEKEKTHVVLIMAQRLKRLCPRVSAASSQTITVG